MIRFAYLIFLATMFLPGKQAFGQTRDVQQLLLNWEKLNQLEEILDNMYKGYKILDEGYTAIKNVAEGNFSLHQLFLDGLLNVSPAVRNYRRIALIIAYQERLVSEYHRAFRRFRQDPNFTAVEITYLVQVYDRLVTASLSHIDELLMIITASELRMSDDERLQGIDRICFDMEGKLTFLRTFNNDTQILAIQRAKANNDIKTIRNIYGIY